MLRSILEKTSLLSRLSWSWSVIRFLTVALICVAIALTAQHAADADDAPFNDKLDALLRKELPKDVLLSLKVIDYRTGKTLMEHNPDTPLIPASTLKVVTSSCALQVLNPEFRFYTEVYVQDSSAGVVGDIYLKGGGDPHLVSEDLFRLARDLKDRGLHRVHGDIIVDDSYFNPEPPLDESEKLGTRAYHAPYSALCLNFNAIKLMVLPGANPGDDAEIIGDPMSEYAQFQGSVKTVKGSKPARLEIEKCPGRNGGEIIKINGVIGAGAAIKGKYVNVANPSLYAGAVFKESLLREGIAVDGRVAQGVTPKEASLFYSFPSLPLSLIVYWLNKHSNNTTAEQLSLSLGAHVYGVPGTRQKGLAVLSRHLENCGVKPESYTLAEASGLSRNNRISASALVKTLFTAAYDFAYNAEFMASLGIAGADGTLKDKFQDPATQRRLRAKTGTLRGINALAGYGLSVDGRPFIFAVMANSTAKNPGFSNVADRVMAGVLDIPMKSGTSKSTGGQPRRR